MPRLPQKGLRFYTALYEDDCTLAQVLTDLGLPLPDEADERQMRMALGIIMGEWSGSKQLIDAKQIAKDLRSLAEKLETLDPIFSVLAGGLHDSREIETAVHLAQVVARCPGIEKIEVAHQFITDFLEKARVIAVASRVASIELESIRGKPGRPAYDWYDDFTRFLVSIAEQNGIKPTLGTNRITGKPEGRLYNLALEFERLLNPDMRSQSPEALKKRLKTSQKRIRKNQNPPPQP